MLRTLRRIIQDVNAARDLDEVLDLIVRRVKKFMAVDVASVYLADVERQQHVLMVTAGLKPEAVGTVRLGLDEGLVGLVAQRAEPVNLDDAQLHPRFRFFPESGEARYHAFLGVPVIHQRKVLGVLVVQRKLAKRFAEDKVTFLFTLAAQLAGAIAHAEASDGSSMSRIRHSPHERFMSGVGGAPGVGAGTAVVVFSAADLAAVPDREITDVDGEIAGFKAAVAAARAEVKQMRRRLSRVLPAEERALFDAYALLMNSDSLINGTMERIRAGNWAQGSLCEVVREHARKFADMDDDYLRERAEDIREIGRRILLHLQRRDVGTRQYPRRTILVGEELAATQLAEVPPKRLAAVVSARGSSSSHVAILARAMGIPAVMGAEDMVVGKVDGRELIVDGYQGRVYVQPSPPVRREYVRLMREESRLSEELQELKDLPAETPDGVRVPLYVNTGLVADVTPSLKSGAEGIGLYRTEFPFMIRERFPGEDEQFNIYRQVLRAFAPRPVTLRTLDVGGDKALPYFPIHEDNPFLGWRGIRITLDHPEIFLTQIRAMLRAASGLDNLHVLLPMISDVTEVDEALKLLERALAELGEEGLNVSRPQMGVMIEVPSSIYQADSLARRVDFFSVGTNDLTQYLLAVDRNNARVAKLYNTLHPAVLRALQQVVEAAHRHGKPVSVCGELGGDPAAAILLLGLGMDALSMTVAGLQRVKWVIRTFSRRRARNLLAKALQMDDGHAIRAMLNQALEQAGLGSLVRAGVRADT
ncbi:MAG: phosphoenolpyruvate--protein phosphotransferase [Gammaproteobacteria bacterium]